MTTPTPLHGAFGSDPTHFVRMLKRQPQQMTKGKLAELALDMQAEPDAPKFEPDAEENMFVPAGFTYFGQFVDHDLSFDTTSTFDGLHEPQSQRTPRFDLDSVYGRGPVDDPQMYDAAGVKLLLGNPMPAPPGRRDLLRNVKGRAQIGDPRNDENSIISNLQAAFITFHNKVVDKLAVRDSLAGPKLFDAARREVRWTYQRILIDDFLPRVINAQVIAAFDALRKPNARGLSTVDAAFVLYHPLNRASIPFEFAGAGYRFGHSMVRSGYVLQDSQIFPIFDGRMDEHSLVGFQPLVPEHVITDWRRFFIDSKLESPNRGETFCPTPGVAAGHGGANDSAPDAPGQPRLQWGYRIDTSLVDPLSMLPASVAGDPPPSLPLRNLWRGAAFELPSGQDFEAKLGVKLDPKYLCTRQLLDDDSLRFVPVNAAVKARTPLWFYILAEAQKPMIDKFGLNTPFDEDALLDDATATATQLGTIGGRILLETFHGLLDSDEASYRNHPKAAGWQPLVAKFRMWDLLTFT